jgi:hypothetical protein
LLEQFVGRRGYDLAPYLPLIIQFGYNHPYNPAITKALYDIPHIGDAVRRDYWKTVDELITERFYRPMVAWARAHRLLSRIQAHGAPVDLLGVYGMADIPETEQFYGDGTLALMKLASSAADITGRRIVSAESFDFRGDSYRITPEQLKQNADKLIVAGVNEIVYHGYPYVYDDRLYPGWGPFNRGGRTNFAMFMNGRNTFWPYVNAVNAYITRLQYIGQTGKTVTPIGIFVSRTGYDRTTEERNASLVEALLSAGYASSYFNAESVLSGHVEAREFVESGGLRLSALVFKDVAWLDVKLAVTLTAIARAGIPVLFIGQRPTASASLRNLDEETALVRRALLEIDAIGNVPVTSNVDSAIKELNRLVAPNVRFPVGKPLPFIEKHVGPLTAIFVANPDPEPVETEMDTTARGAPESWDPWTGETQPFAEVESAGDTQRLGLRLSPYGSILLLFNPDEKSARHREPRVWRETGRTIPLGSATWQFHAVGRDARGQSVTFDRTFATLTDWSGDDQLRTFSGRGTYVTTIELPLSIAAGKRQVWLDLGDVRDVAELKMNAHSAGTLIMKPYGVDITKWVHPGKNILEVTVVNALSNAVGPRPPTTMLGNGADESPRAFGTDAARPAGLIGPVTFTVRDCRSAVATRPCPKSVH